MTDRTGRTANVAAALTALGVDWQATQHGDGVGDVRLADLARKIADGIADHYAGRLGGVALGGLAFKRTSDLIAPLLDREALALATGLPVASAAGDASRTRAAEALAEVCVLAADEQGQRRPLADIAGGVVDGVLALCDDDNLTGGDAGRRRAVACLAALLDGALLADLVAERSDGVDVGADAPAAVAGGGR